MRLGFGVLFFGYLTTYLLSFNPYAALTRLAGYLIIFAALSRLRRHNVWFAYSRLADIPLLLLALVDTVVDLAIRIMGEQAPAMLETAVEPISGAMTLFALVFHVFLLMALYTIAVDTGLPKLARHARLNLVLMAAYALLHVIWLLPVDLAASYTKTLSIMLLLLRLIWTLTNLALIFRCYMWICLEGDEDMAQKPSRFAFVNRMREKQAAREQQAVDEAVAYAKQKRARRADKLGPAATKPKYRKKKKKK